MIRLKNFLRALIPYKSKIEPGISSSLITGNGNEIQNSGTFRNVSIDISGFGNKILIGKNSLICNTLIYIRGDNHFISFGENCYFGGGELWIEDHNCSLRIHNNTTVERGHLAVTEPYSNIEIKEDCMLARFVELRTGDSHSIIDLQSGKRINKAKDITIEAHVWIGAHAKILKGVIIGKNSIIGTASVVTKEIGPNSVASGVPAKVIRTGVTWDRRRLQE